MGYSWWLHDDGPFAAHGTKGQFIYVIPESDLVVVFTSNNIDAKYPQPQVAHQRLYHPSRYRNFGISRVTGTEGVDHNG